MEVAKLISSTIEDKKDELNDDEEVMLPGFRFHPTDEELVGFYLQRKVDKKPINSIELIKQVDIYKYDPWDLPIGSVGDKEWYFFCIRGRKYRNSIRPNRVTGSGFWKATGIDKPIHSPKEPHDCIGLKKSLVYYRGSAGKGTKTDWMMHEFRLPPNGKTNIANIVTTTHHVKNNIVHHEAEVWTLCRIFKRISYYKKYAPQWREPAVPTTTHDSSSKTCSFESDQDSFGDSSCYNVMTNERKPAVAATIFSDQMISATDDHQRNHYFLTSQLAAAQAQEQPPHTTTMAYTSFCNNNIPSSSDDFFVNGNWDELRPVVELVVDSSQPYYGCR